MAEAEKVMLIGGDGRNGRGHTFKMLALVGALVVIICGGIGIGAYIYIHHKHEVVAEQQAKKKAEAKLPGQSLQDKVNAGLANEKYDDTLAMLNAQQPNDTHEVQGDIALVYLTEQKNQKALDVYGQIDKKFGLTRSEAANAGYAAQSLNQKDQALQYYTKAKDLAVKENGALKDSYVKEYTKDIEALQK